MQKFLLFIFLIPALFCKTMAMQVLDKKLHIPERNASGLTLITAVKTQSGAEITYDDAVNKLLSQSIIIRNSSPTVREALNWLKSDINVGYKNKDNYIILTLLPRPQQPGRIIGKVFDDRGEPLPAAGIKILETGAVVQSSVDGSYALIIKPGVYTLEISYISFQTKRITEITVKEGQATNLNIVLNPSTSALKQVTVTGSYKKESTANLYVQQKNAAALTDGISAEQIARTPDRHVGETLSRITGVSTTDGKRVVVRGIAERYNVATLNGSTLPSTDVQERNFEFDLIPTNMVDQVVVAKSITPDMPYGFAGGLVQITTKAIPYRKLPFFFHRDRFQ